MAITFDQYRDICNYKIARAAKKKLSADLMGLLRQMKEMGVPEVSNEDIWEFEPPKCSDLSGPAESALPTCQRKRA